MWKYMKHLPISVRFHFQWMKKHGIIDRFMCVATSNCDELYKKEENLIKNITHLLLVNRPRLRPTKWDVGIVVGKEMLTAGVLTARSRMVLVDVVLIRIAVNILMMRMSAIVMNNRRWTRTNGSMATAILAEIQGQLLDVVGLWQILLGQRFLKWSMGERSPWATGWLVEGCLAEYCWGSA